MLATTAPAVKLTTFSTPEQTGCTQAVDRSLTTFWALVERLRSAADKRQPIHQVEEAIFRDLLAMGLDLLRAFLERQRSDKGQAYYRRRRCHAVSQSRKRGTTENRLSFLPLVSFLPLA